MEAPDRPLTPEEHARLEPQAATEPEPQEERVIASALLAGDGEDAAAVDTHVTRVEGTRGEATWRVEVTTRAPEREVSLPQPELHVLERPGEHSDGGDGHVPPWIGTSPVPEAAPPERRRVEVRRGDEVLDPLWVLLKDGRVVYSAVNAPWGSVCEISTAAGAPLGSGVLIGHRHVLTASHVIPWPDTALRVTVRRFDNLNRGVANATAVLAFNQIDTATTVSVDEDYAVIVIDKRLGTKRGFLGYRTYNGSWDGEPWWFSMGYAGDLANGTRPCFQRDFKLDEEDFDYGGGRAMTTKTGDFVEGQSGSPVFAWFAPWDKWPKVVGVVSAQHPTESLNYVAGGSDLSALIGLARALFP